MNIIIESSIKSLEKSRVLLGLLSNEDLSNSTISPYYSSIGSHIRHIYDFYECILNGINKNYINLTLRSRDINTETNCDYALLKVNTLIKDLQNIKNLKQKILVNDNLGIGNIEIEYSIESILAQANSHTIHHYAIINYILDRLDICFDDADFGFNPTTPRLKTNLN